MVTIRFATIRTWPGFYFVADESLKRGISCANAKSFSHRIPVSKLNVDCHYFLAITLADHIRTKCNCSRNCSACTLFFMKIKFSAYFKHGLLVQVLPIPSNLVFRLVHIYIYIYSCSSSDSIQFHARVYCCMGCPTI